MRILLKIHGITHLLAVSGSNVAYIILATKFIFDKVFGKKISNYLCLITIVVFMLVSGASASVVRASIMAIILILSELLLKKSNTILSLVMSALIILVINPFSICDIGFILSFGGAFGIILLNNNISSFIKKRFFIVSKYKMVNSMIEIISVSLSAQIMILPIMWFYYNKISIISIFTNLFAVPLAGIISILILSIYCIGLLSMDLSKIISYPTYILISLLINISKLFGAFDFSNITLITPSIITIITYYIVLFLICFKERINKKFFKFFILSIMFFYILFQFYNYVIPNGFVEVNMVDVGQGDCFHIKTINRKNIFIDSGGSENGDYDVEKNILAPYILNNTNGVIDILIISHFHEDHAEGALYILNNFKVKRLIFGTQPCSSYLYEEVLKICKEKSIQILMLSSKDYYLFDNIRFDFLYPSKKIDSFEDLNNNSLIVKVTVLDTTILFTGDAEENEEEALLNYFKSDSKFLDIDILKVGHHGSKTSSSEELLKVTTPYIFLISCGVNNKFGHPHGNTLEKLSRYSKYIFRTDLNGEISLKIFPNKQIKVNTIIK